MNTLHRLTSIIRTGDSITLTLNRVSGGIEVIVQPAIAKANDNDPTLAQLRGLLATPFYFTVPDGATVDAALAAHIDATADARASVITAEETYLSAVNAAVAKAKSEATKKAAAPAKQSKPGKTPPVTVEEVPDGEGGEDEGDAGEGEAASVTAPPPASTAPAPAPAAGGLFSDLGL